ncbi:MAG: hypothetical protein JRJ00_14255 [Deltaproteobacteria bacterium]|nr:hypothetical protein [Deltaproteobacteria bacterium]
MKNICKTFLFLGLFFAIGSCVGHSTQYVGSRPSVGDKPALLNINDHKINLPGIALNIKPRNEIVSSRVAHLSIIPVYVNTADEQLNKNSLFKIQISLQPHKAGFSFDPRQIIVEIDGKVYPIVGVTGPKSPPSYLDDATIRRWMKSGAVICSVRAQHIVENEFPNAPIFLTEIGEWYCFDLMFKVPPPSPEKNFDLDGVGIFCDGKQLKLEKIQFEKAKWSEYNT